MPSSFTDASADLVKAFNREHRGRIHLKLIRGPLNTESISDLAISSLLLGDAPFDALLMDVTWLPKYAAAGWLEALDPWFGQGDQEQLCKVHGWAMTTTAISIAGRWWPMWDCSTGVRI